MSTENNVTKYIERNTRELQPCARDRKHEGQGHCMHTIPLPASHFIAREKRNPERYY